MIDALLATLERDADTEVTRTLDEAQRQAAELTGAAEQRIAERRAAVLAQREATSRVEHERALSAARQQARTRELEARAAYLERVFTALRAALPEIGRSATYRSTLADEVRRLDAFTGGAPIDVRCAPALVPALRRLITTNGHVRIQRDAGIPEGFRMVGANGTLEIDATLEGRIERLRPQLALAAVAAIDS